MISIKIPEQKIFMSKLLTSELFDLYFLESASIDTYNSFSIDGRIHREFFKDLSSTEEVPSEEFSRWSRIRPICLDLIKGRQTPLSFKFVLIADDETKEKILRAADTDISPDLISLGLNIRFAKGQMLITTGTSMKIFSTDKSTEKAWDKYIPSFLESNSIKNDID